MAIGDDIEVVGHILPKIEAVAQRRMPGGVLGHDFKERGIDRGIHVLLAFERRAVLPAAITRQVEDQRLHWLPGCDLAIFHLPVDKAGFGSRRAGSRSICVELIDVKLPVGNITQLHGVDLHVGTLFVCEPQRQFGDIAVELAVQRRSRGRDRHDAIHQQVVGPGVVHILLRADILTKDFQFSNVVALPSVALKPSECVLASTTHLYSVPAGGRMIGTAIPSENSLIT